MVQHPMPPEKKFVDSLFCTYILSVLASWAAEFVTYPLDLTKTRLQIQGEIANKQDLKLVSAPHRGMLRTGFGIIKEEGLFKLWQGIPAQLVRHSIYTGSRVVTYKLLRDNVFTPNSNNHLPLWKSALCGICAGSFSQVLANPADVVKVQLQMEGKRRLLNLPPRVHGITHAFVSIVQTSGIRGLWKGSVPNAYRAAFVNLGDLTAYDSSKQFILRNTDLKDGTFVHLMSSLCAGFTAASLGTPADTIKTRIMNQPVRKDGNQLYHGMIDCLAKTVKNEGIFALYKGFFPNWLRMAPWSVTFWLCYESSNKFLKPHAQNKHTL